MSYLLRKQSLIEEIDYNFLINALKTYKFPRNKIKQLIDKKEIIKIKKGLYVFGETSSLEPYSVETLANLIYGPSYISMEYALSFYGMIPERVTTITSITNKRNKYFKTHIGDFSYQYINSKLYPNGITIKKIDEKHQILLASKEKALIDMLYFNKKNMNTKEIEEYILDNLRIDESELMKLDSVKLKKLENIYGNYTKGISDFIKRLEQINE